MILDNKLNFNEHLQQNVAKANKTIGVIRKLHLFLPIPALLTIYKSFIRLHIDYLGLITVILFDIVVTCYILLFNIFL